MVTIVLILYILASVKGIFLKIHVFNHTLPLKPAQFFICDPSVIISTVREEQWTCLSDSALPGNGLSCKSIPVAPHTLPTCGIYWLYSNNTSVHFTCITMYRLAVSQLAVEGFS